MRRPNTIITGFIFLLVLLSSGLFAQNPVISIQGTLKDANGASVDDGVQTATFRLYDALTGGINVWEETAQVTVLGGIYSHSLGKVEPLVGGDFASTVYLSVEVGGLELSPRTEMTYAPYALAVNSAQQIAQRGCSGQVGDIKYSILPPTQFATQNGECWVPMDGRGISGTSLASLMLIATIPDMSGLFMRATEYSGDNDPGRANNASYSLQTDENKEHDHDLDLRTEQDGRHEHDVSVDLLLVEQGPFSNGDAVINGGFRLNAGGNPNPTAQVTTSGETISDGPHNHEISGKTVESGGNETRPKNMNFFIYIRVD
jgi:hypothetical protein